MIFDFLDTAGTLVVLALLVVASSVGAVLSRHALLRRRGASLHCAIRLGPIRDGNNWRAGVARYTPTRLQWFRLFSVAPHPKLTLARRSITVTGRRAPRAFEIHSVPAGSVILRCSAISQAGVDLGLELAMSEDALTGFLAWLESSPPGAHSRADAGRRA